MASSPRWSHWWTRMGRCRTDHFRCPFFRGVDSRFVFSKVFQTAKWFRATLDKETHRLCDPVHISLPCMVWPSNSIWWSEKWTFGHPQRCFRLGATPDISEWSSPVFRSLADSHVFGCRCDMGFCLRFSVLSIALRREAVTWTLRWGLWNIHAWCGYVVAAIRREMKKDKNHFYFP